MSIKELNEYCVMMAKCIIVHRGKLCGFKKDYKVG